MRFPFSTMKTYFTIHNEMRYDILQPKEALPTRMLNKLSSLSRRIHILVSLISPTMFSAGYLFYLSLVILYVGEAVLVKLQKFVFQKISHNELNLLSSLFKSVIEIVSKTVST